jgi:hypothetical protein
MQKYLSNRINNISDYNCLAVCDAAILTGSHTGEAGGT